MSKFKVGDVLKSLFKGPRHNYKVDIGDLVEVTEVFAALQDEFAYKLYNNGSGTTYVGFDSEFELVSSGSQTSFVMPTLPNNPGFGGGWGSVTLPPGAGGTGYIQDEGHGSQLIEPVQQKCECGSTIVNSQFHSTWCPMFKSYNS